MLTTENYIKREGETVDTPEMRLSFANHVNGVTISQPEPGYLTVVTRCFKHKEKLGINQRSLSYQSDGDWDQVCIHDEVGIGLHKANGLFHKYRHLVKGEYVLLLDDDDKLIDYDFVKQLKLRNEDIVWFKMQMVGKLVLGEDEDYQPKLGHICGSCVVVKNHVYQRFIHLYKRKEYGGDFGFLSEIWKDKYSYSKYHLGELPITAIQSG